MPYIYTAVYRFEFWVELYNFVYMAGEGAGCGAGDWLVTGFNHGNETP